ncbi:hypothetical protein BZA70DRAFT_295378 [Myxozyma melibiosi]|uniref:C2H2-type domain-containing protein n=1 Tax=Myxozyma melibiosi TaxID=54550 RepID=A0ABR1F6Y3_9ASCO
MITTRRRSSLFDLAWSAASALENTSAPIPADYPLIPSELITERRRSDLFYFSLLTMQQLPQQQQQQQQQHQHFQVAVDHLTYQPMPSSSYESSHSLDPVEILPKYISSLEDDSELSSQTPRHYSAKWATFSINSGSAASASSPDGPQHHYSPTEFPPAEYEKATSPATLSSPHSMPAYESELAYSATIPGAPNYLYPRSPTSWETSETEENEDEDDEDEDDEEKEGDSSSELTEASTAQTHEHHSQPAHSFSFTGYFQNATAEVHQHHAHHHHSEPMLMAQPRRRSLRNMNIEDPAQLGFKVAFGTFYQMPETTNYGHMAGASYIKSEGSKSWSGVEANAEPAKVEYAEEKNEDSLDEDEDDDSIPIETKMAQTKKGMYRCSHCSRKYATMYLFWEHIEQEKLPRPFKCTKKSCPWSLVGFPNRNECSRHIRHQHEQARGFSCSYAWCTKKFHRKDSQNRHIKLVHQKPDSRLNRKIDKKRREEEARERKRLESGKRGRGKPVRRDSKTEVGGAVGGRGR